MGFARTLSVRANDYPFKRSLRGKGAEFARENKSRKLALTGFSKPGGVAVLLGTALNTFFDGCSFAVKYRVALGN
jgi:hypothetical protein